MPIAPDANVRAFAALGNRAAGGPAAVSAADVVEPAEEAGDGIAPLMGGHGYTVSGSVSAGRAGSMPSARSSAGRLTTRRRPRRRTPGSSPRRASS